jgi:hypothetical protein
MAERHDPIIEFPRHPPKDEAERLYRCPACGGWVDCRDLAKCSTAPTKFNYALTDLARQLT